MSTLIVTSAIAVDRAEPERRSVAESLGRRPVAQDQLADRAGVIGRIERLGDGIEDALPDPDAAGGSASRLAAHAVSAPPAATRMAPGVEVLGQVVVDVADRHGARLAGPCAARLDPDEPTGGDQLVLHRLAIGGRQRPRCQDLPSVWVDGA